MIKKNIFSTCFKSVIIISVLVLFRQSVYAETEQIVFKDYKNRIEGVTHADDIPNSGFAIQQEHVFTEEFENLGILTVIPVIDEPTGRLVIFFTDMSGNIQIRTDDFETNSWNKSKLRQPNNGLYAVGFRDVNNDGLKDIILVQLCQNQPLHEGYFKAGDVLFQGDTSFYRDIQISDTINRYRMCTSADMIADYVRDGISTEFLYNAKTKSQLLENGFEPLEFSPFFTYFEHFGQTEVLAGTFTTAEHHIFMIYIIDKEGCILWNFQPMGGADAFIVLMDITFQDINGDGLKDVAFEAGYRYMDEFGEIYRMNKYEIYYQQAGYFIKDESFRASGLAVEDEGLREVIKKAKGFWRW